MLKGFRDFIQRGNVVDLAVAVVVGAAFGAVVTALATDFIGSLIAAAGGVPDLTAVGPTVNGTLIKIGTTIGALINFVIVAAVVYFAVVAPLNAWSQRRRQAAEVEPAPVPQDVALLQEIRDLLRAQAGRSTGE